MYEQKMEANLRSDNTKTRYPMTDLHIKLCTNCNMTNWKVSCENTIQKCQHDKLLAENSEQMLTLYNRNKQDIF